MSQELPPKSRRTIQVDVLARVEGEGSLYVLLEDGRLQDVKLKIFEPPRFFEGFLRGRKFSEAPDITARICGICPVAYQMSACHAIEQALGLRVEGGLRELRRLLYCGEWIESHGLHIYLLHAPDFLGYEDAIRLAKDHPAAVQTGLALKKTGNEIVRVLGGREIHPINVRVGGFYRLPRKEELQALREPLQRARDQALQTLKLTAGFEFPDFEMEYEYVSLWHPDEYPLNEGRLRSSRGLDIPVSDFPLYFEEIHVAHSNALHAVIKGRDSYHVGPLARFHLNYQKLPPICRQAAHDAGLVPDCRNPFKSILARGVETLFAIEEALRIIDSYEPPPRPCLEFRVRAGEGAAATEAPRGILYHQYRLDREGIIQEARIVPPTSQNQKQIENDLRFLVPKFSGLSDEQLTWRCEQAIRNYDPCISCATHFLKLKVERR